VTVRTKIGDSAENDATCGCRKRMPRGLYTPRKGVSAGSDGLLFERDSREPKPINFWPVQEL
jgi:hypothetical protein